MTRATDESSQQEVRSLERFGPPHHLRPSRSLLVGKPVSQQASKPNEGPIRALLRADLRGELAVYGRRPWNRHPPQCPFHSRLGVRRLVVLRWPETVRSQCGSKSLITLGPSQRSRDVPGTAEDPGLKFWLDDHRSCPVLHTCPRQVRLKLALKFGCRFRGRALPGEVEQNERVLRPSTQAAEELDAIMKAARIVLRMD